MFKRVEIFCSLKRVWGFAPKDSSHIRQRHLTCVCGRGILPLGNFL